MAGIDVSKTTMDTRSAEAVLLLRNAFDKCHSIAQYLANYPVVEGSPDPLIAKLSYTADECATLRIVFVGFDAAKTTLDYNFGVARKLTGLE